MFQLNRRKGRALGPRVEILFVTTWLEYRKKSCAKYNGKAKQPSTIKRPVAKPADFSSLFLSPSHPTPPSLAVINYVHNGIFTFTSHFKRILKFCL